MTPTRPPSRPSTPRPGPRPAQPPRPARPQRAALPSPYDRYRPGYTVVLHIAPELRARRPEWPLSLEEALNAGKPPPDASSGHLGRSRWTELQGILQSSARARAIVRETLTEWGLESLAPDCELLASELVANAVEHVKGHPVGLSIDEHRPPGQPAWIKCGVTDTAPRPPVPRQAGPDDERGRGLAIVTAVAATSGCEITPDGKKTWFTLTAAPERELEAGA
jgi:anti-sigma regulatory factor (Ser/Thr protein kinase)